MKLTRDEKNRLHEEINARLHARSRFVSSSGTPDESTNTPLLHHEEKDHRSFNIIGIATILAVGVFGFLVINHMGDPLFKRRLMSVFPGSNQWQPLHPQVFADDQHVSISNHDSFAYENTIIEMHTESLFSRTYRLAIGSLVVGATQRYKIADFVSGNGLHFHPAPKDRLSIRVICDTSKGAQSGTWTND